MLKLSQTKIISWQSLFILSSVCLLGTIAIPEQVVDDLNVPRDKLCYIYVTQHTSVSHYVL